MGVVILSGEKFDGVDFGTAPGSGTGYVIGTTPVSELLLVEEAKHAALINGVKYYHHPSGHQSDAKKPSDQLVRMTMLVSKGRWRQKVWSESGQSIELRLQEPGDFIAWIPGLWHSWYAEADSTMLTVNLIRKSAKTS